MISLLLILPLAFFSAAMSVLVGMFTASLVVAMGVFMGTLTVFSTGFLTFMILMFS